MNLTEAEELAVREGESETVRKMREEHVVEVAQINALAYGIIVDIREIEAQRDELLAACKAALRYDASICGAAARGEVKYTDGDVAYADTEEPDALYMDWISKAKAAIAKAEGDSK